MKLSVKQKLWIIIIILLLPIAVYANAGVPMIFISYPVMLFSLIPIILVESGIFVKILNISFKKSMLSNSISNIVSTTAGFPLAWFFLLFIEQITTGFSCGPGFDTIQNSIITAIVEAAWLCPWEKYLYWLIPTAFMINVIIAFFISILIEYFLNKKFYPEHDKKNIRKATIYANIFSYSILLIISTIYLVNAIVKNLQ